VPEGRILLVESKAETSAYLRGLLDAHWDVETVESGVDALGVVRTRPPDILLTNATPAAGYGVTLLRELRSKPATRDLPVLMYSDRVDEASLEAFEEGVDDYLIEPFTGRELLARVSGAIKLARMRADVSQARAEAQVAKRQGIRCQDRRTRAADTTDGDRRLRLHAPGWQPAERLGARESGAGPNSAQD
jgi:DNA-binding response OmpR family regulator